MTVQPRSLVDWMPLGLLAFLPTPVAQLLAGFSSRGMVLTNSAQVAIAQIQPDPPASRARIFGLISPVELGGVQSLDSRWLVDFARKEGFLLPVTAALQIRLQCPRQPEGGYSIVITEPVMVCDCPVVFCVANDGRHLLLDTVSIHHIIWLSDVTFILGAPSSPDGELAERESLLPAD